MEGAPALETSELSSSQLDQEESAIGPETLGRRERERAGELDIIGMFGSRTEDLRSEIRATPEFTPTSSRL